MKLLFVFFLLIGLTSFSQKLKHFDGVFKEDIEYVSQVDASHINTIGGVDSSPYSNEVFLEIPHSSTAYFLTSALEFLKWEDFSFSFWIYPESFPSNNYLFSIQTVMSGYWYIRLETGGRLTFYYNNGNGSKPVTFTFTSSAALTTKTWHFVELRFDVIATTLYWYIKNAQRGSLNIGSKDFSVRGTVYMNRYLTNYGSGYGIDNVCYMNSIFTLDDLEVLYGGKDDPSRLQSDPEFIGLYHLYIMDDHSINLPDNGSQSTHFSINGSSFSWENY